ncbi:MAG: hypothetical protein AAFZ11_00955 [Pseudomonadota bacterium]
MQYSQVRVRTFSPGVIALGADADILTDNALAQADTTVVLAAALDGQPDVARNITVKGNDSNVTGNVVIAGTNIDGHTITETIALNAANVVAGNLAFASITSVTLPAYDTADTERVRIGLGAKIGLPDYLSRDTVIAAFLDGAREATRPSVAVSTTALAANTVTLNSALDGTAVIVDLYETQ